MQIEQELLLFPFLKGFEQWRIVRDIQVIYQELDLKKFIPPSDVPYIVPMTSNTNVKNLPIGLNIISASPHFRPLFFIHFKRCLTIRKFGC